MRRDGRGGRAGVTGFAVGDRVMAFAPASFASIAVTRADCVCPLAEAIDFAAGATIPVAFLTVLYALGRLGRLQPGERVLIHGGTGAVGLAAIQYGAHVGAIVFATAGSPVKRAILRAAGVDHVPRFADAALRRRGDGADRRRGRRRRAELAGRRGDGAQPRLLRPFGRFPRAGQAGFLPEHADRGCARSGTISPISRSTQTSWWRAIRSWRAGCSTSCRPCSRAATCGRCPT